MAIVFNIDASNTSSYPGSGNTWYDISGNGNDVTLVNSPTWNANGWFEFAFANNQYGTFSDANLASGSSSRTVSAWFNVSGATNNFQTLTAYGTVGTGLGNALYLKYGTYASYYSGYSSDLDSNYSSMTNIWYNTIATYDGTTAKVYVNGLLRNSASLSWNTTKNGTAFICRNDWNASELFNGKLGSVKHWDTALTDAEVYTEYVSTYLSHFTTGYDVKSAGMTTILDKYSRDYRTQSRFFTSEPQITGPIIGPSQHAAKPQKI